MKKRRSGADMMLISVLSEVQTYRECMDPVEEFMNQVSLHETDRANFRLDKRGMIGHDSNKCANSDSGNTQLGKLRNFLMPTVREVCSQSPSTDHHHSAEAHTKKTGYLLVIFLNSRLSGQDIHSMFEKNKIIKLFGERGCVKSSFVPLLKRLRILESYSHLRVNFSACDIGTITHFDIHLPRKLVQFATLRKPNEQHLYRLSPHICDDLSRPVHVCLREDHSTKDNQLLMEYIQVKLELDSIGAQILCRRNKHPITSLNFRLLFTDSSATEEEPFYLETRKFKCKLDQYHPVYTATTLGGTLKGQYNLTDKLRQLGHHEILQCVRITCAGDETEISDIALHVRIQRLSVAFNDWPGTYVFSAVPVWKIQPNSRATWSLDFLMSESFAMEPGTPLSKPERHLSDPGMRKYELSLLQLGKYTGCRLDLVINGSQNTATVRLQTSEARELYFEAPDVGHVESASLQADRPNISIGQFRIRKFMTSDEISVMLAKPQFHDFVPTSISLSSTGKFVVPDRDKRRRTAKHHHSTFKIPIAHDFTFRCPPSLSKNSILKPFCYELCTDTVDVSSNK